MLRRAGGCSAGSPALLPDFRARILVVVFVLREVLLNPGVERISFSDFYLRAVFCVSWRVISGRFPRRNAAVVNFS